MAPRSLEYHDVMGTRSFAVLLVSDVNVQKVLFWNYCYFIFTWCHVFLSAGSVCWLISSLLAWVCLVWAVFKLMWILPFLLFLFLGLRLLCYWSCMRFIFSVLLCGVMVRFFVRMFCVAALFIYKNAHIPQSRTVDSIPQSCIGCNSHLVVWCRYAHWCFAESLLAHVL